MTNRRFPTTKIHHHLRWTRSGVVWADYLLTGVPYGYRSVDDKRAVRSLHRMLIRALSGEALLRGVCASLNPLAVVERMEQGVDLGLHPAWDAECDATVDTLRRIQPGQRLYWLSVPLSGGSVPERVKAAFASAVDSGAEWLGMPASLVPDEEVERRARQAERIVDAIPHHFKPVPATPAQMVWLWEHDLRRGLQLDSDLPDHHTTASGVKSAAAFSPARLDEGAQLDRPSSGISKMLPTMHSVLRVDTPWQLGESPPSYQVNMALANMPSEGSLFPGSEYLSLCDDIPGLDVDWTMRLSVRSSEEVRQKNRRALVNLKEQVEQRSGEISHVGNELAVVAEDLAEYEAQLAADRSEVEVEWTTIFTVGAPTADQAVHDARELAKEFENSDYRLTTPMGYQEDLFWAGVPGVPTSSIVREFKQLTTSQHWAAFVPLVSNDLGDDTGPVLGVNITTARLGIIHHDLAGKAVRDVSGSLAVTGDLGSGKSVLLKSVAGHLVDRGGQILAIDSTSLGEYEKWANSITDATVVNLAEPAVTLDPLQMFAGDPKRASQVATTILMPMMRLEPDGDLGQALSQALEPTYRQQFGLESLADVADHLTDKRCEIDSAKALSDKMRVFIRDSSTDVLFKRDLPTLDVDAPAIVFRTHRLALPDREDLENEYMARQLTISARVGHVLYQLILELAREVCFADPDQLSGILCDETHRLTTWQRGVRILGEFIRDGRKHGAFVLLGSQDPERDFGDDTMRGLIPTRIVMRQTDDALAKKCLRWLGVGDDDPILVKQLTEQTSPATGPNKYVAPERRGEGFLRDASGSIGRFKALAPSSQHRFEAVTTTPKEPRDKAAKSSALVGADS